MKYDEIFLQLWQVYSEQIASAKRVFELFTDEGEQVVNDHIALRTFGDKRVDIEVMAKIFESVGYEEKNEYHFEQKKLRAKHYENPKIADAPRVFISELKLNECSGFLQETIQTTLNKCNDKVYETDELVFSGALWGKVSHTTYLKLREESEYAAWLYVYGFRPNHFTISINSLKKYGTIEKVNQFLKDKGFTLNTSGGEIKGSPEILLEQSSILADIIEVEFEEGKFKIPACYYEFAKRYPDASGKLYSGFHAKSADKIFESTDFYKK